MTLTIERNTTMRERPLTPKQKRFAEEYPIDFNLTQAAIRAGYSPRSAHSTAQVLIKNPKVKIYIDTIKESQIASVQVTINQILHEVSAIARSDDPEVKTRDRLNAYKMLIEWFRPTIQNKASKNLTIINQDHRSDSKRTTTDTAPRAHNAHDKSLSTSDVTIDVEEP